MQIFLISDFASLIIRQCLYNVVYQVSASNLVALSSRAVDVYKAAATAYASATVVSSSNTFNLTSYINKGLSTALNTGDADLLGRTIALSASSFSSTINCTATPPQVRMKMPLPLCVVIHSILSLMTPPPPPLPPSLL